MIVPGGWGGRVRGRLLLLCYGAILFLVAMFAPPLGHDEATYALGGLALTGEAPIPFPIYRPVGMQLLAAPGVLAGGSDLALRALPIGLAVLMIAATWWCARELGAPGWSAAIVATSLDVVRRGTQLSSDVAATLCVLAVVMVLMRGLRRDRWYLIWLGPFAAAAFYVRYGSMIALASVAVAAAIVWRRELRRCAVPLAIAGLVFALALIPHLLSSLRATDQLTGILALSRLEANQQYLGDGLLYYATTWWRHIGPLAMLAMLAGAYRAFAHPSDLARFFGLGAGFIIVGYGLTAHGEARYVLVAEIMLVSVGASFLAARRGSRLVAIIGIGCIATLIWGAALATRWRSSRPPHDAARIVQRAAAGEPCRIISTHPKQVAWYSGCETREPSAIGSNIDGAPFVIVFGGVVAPPLEPVIAAARRIGQVPGAEVYRVFTPSP